MIVYVYTGFVCEPSQLSACNRGNRECAKLVREMKGDWMRIHCKRPIAVTGSQRRTVDT
jgi:hypothetical protein